jgi:hypothetical protein
VWQTRIEPFLAQHARVLVACFLLLGIGRIVSTYHVFATTGDEPAHIACGLQYVAQHIYHYETQHPPLTRAMIAFLPYLSGTRPQGQPSFQLEGWKLITYEQHPEQTVTLMRLGILPFFVLGGLVVFYWARRYFGIATGVIATLLFTLIPTVLAHAGLATTDMGLAACLGSAFLAMLVWAEEPGPRHGVIFGFCMALALLSKFTTLGFFPVGAAIGLSFYLAAERPGIERLKRLVKERAASFGIAVGVCLLTVWAAYFFSFGKVPFWNVSLPAWEYFDGIRVALLHNTEGHPAWLLGEARRFGWWYYFPVALAVKTPLALLLLVLVGTGVCLEKPPSRGLPDAAGLHTGRSTARHERQRQHRRASRAAGLPGVFHNGVARAGATGAILQSRGVGRAGRRRADSVAGRDRRATPSGLHSVLQ